MNQFVILIQFIILVPMLKTQRINMTSQFYVCDAQNDCSGKEIVCMFEGSCHIECNAPNVCQNTIMRVETPTTLAVKCSVNNSCPSANISNAVRVEGYGENALESATINCRPGGSCHIICDGSNSCLNAIIRGTASSANSGVTVNCNAYQSCHNIDLHCPASGPSYWGCEIHGNGDELYDIHTDFNIYGPNGWADVGFVDYNAYVEGGSFHCGGEDSWSSFFEGDAPDGYSCEIEYGLWDCKDPTSPCSDQTYFGDNRESFIVDHDDDLNGTTLLICEELDTSGPFPYDLFAACNLICRGNNTCRGVEFVCAAIRKKECNIICSGENSCNGLIVNDPSTSTTDKASNNNIHILCGNNGACQNSYLAPAPRMQILTTFRVNLFGENNLVGAVIDCSAVYSGGNSKCDVRCQNDLSCKSGTVHSEEGYFVNIDIQCNGNFNSCSDMTVLCSKYGDCVMRGLSADENTNFNIYSRESWDAIDLSGWQNKAVVGDRNMMLCGSDYNMCIIDNSWNCSCLIYPTRSPTQSPLPTTSPTPLPTRTPTKSPTSASEQIDEGWFVVAIVFIVLFGVAGLVLVYFGYVHYYADEKTSQTTKYGKVGTAEVEVANLNTIQDD